MSLSISSSSQFQKSFDALSLNEDRDSGQKPQMAVSKIQFTQNTIGSFFSDGTEVSDLTQKLATGQILPDRIASIRVVYYQSQFWTLDNRRLRAFKDSFTDTIPVVVVDLKDPNIKREFWEKKTNKSLHDGGSFRNDSIVFLNAQQFEEGVYVFNKKVLNWNLEQIQLSMPEHKKIPLQDKYSNRQTYYESFKKFIFEEARAILQAGFQKVEVQKEHPLQLSLIDLKTAKNPENPTEMKFLQLEAQKGDIKPSDAFLLESVKYPYLKILALANYLPSDLLNAKLSFKVVIDEELRESYDTAFEEGQKWKGKKLGSLITLQRIFDACTTALGKSETSLEKYILSGKYPFSSVAVEMNEVEKQFLDSLNPSQRESVEKFLQLKEGLSLIQGPPGTGKTTTIIHLLKVLQMRQERVLVSASSNKAVHILAQRFQEKFPDVPILLVGVEEKLPPDSPLNSIFMDMWSIKRGQYLDQLSHTLWRFQPQKLIPIDSKFIQDRIEKKCKELIELKDEFLSFVKDVKKYQFSHINCDSISKSFEQAVISYNEHIHSHSISEWEQVKVFYEQEALNSMPEWIGSIRSDISTLATIISSLKGKLNEISETKLLNHSQLIFATLSTSGQQRFKDVRSFDTLIVDEAGQAIEAETLIPMKMNPKKCLLIGDIRQLPATVISQDAEKLKFGRSMMERLIDACDYPSSMLKIQYRMRPEISYWPSIKYYQNMLENDPSVCMPEYALKEIENKTPFLAPYAFIDIDGKEEKDPSGRSYFNVAEVNSTALILDYLAKKCRIDVETRVSVISFYASQIKQIQNALSSKYSNIKINTVDGFQGGESDIVIISCVRANFEKQIGFLKASKRLNVALTRARFSLIILGNQPTLMRSDIGELVKDAEKRNVAFKQEEIEKLRQSLYPPRANRNPKMGKNAKIQDKGNPKIQVCFSFARSSSCPFGDRCKFLHK